MQQLASQQQLLQQQQQLAVPPQLVSTPQLVSAPQQTLAAAVVGSQPQMQPIQVLPQSLLQSAAQIIPTAADDRQTKTLPTVQQLFPAVTSTTPGSIQPQQQVVFLSPAPLQPPIMLPNQVNSYNTFIVCLDVMYKT